MLKPCGSSHLSPLERRLARREEEEATQATIQGKRWNSPEIEVTDARECGYCRNAVEEDTNLFRAWVTRAMVEQRHPVH